MCEFLKPLFDFHVPKAFLVHALFPLLLSIHESGIYFPVTTSSVVPFWTCESIVAIASDAGGGGTRWRGKTGGTWVAAGIGIWKLAENVEILLEITFALHFTVLHILKDMFISRLVANLHFRLFLIFYPLKPSQLKPMAKMVVVAFAVGRMFQKFYCPFPTEEETKKNSKRFKRKQWQIGVKLLDFGNWVNIPFLSCLLTFRALGLFWS